MERAITNKMTFYDIGTLIIPSALICYSYIWKPLGCISATDIWVKHVAYFGVLLMVGLLLKSIGAFWSSFWFRNNTDVIQQEREKVTNVGGNLTKCRFVDIIVFDPLRFIIGPIMRSFYTSDQKELKEYFNKYDDAYKQAYYGKRIEILESHVAFLQTWVVALVVFLFENWDYACCIIAACYVSIVIMLSIQRKIYNMIWEAPIEGGADNGTK